MARGPTSSTTRSEAISPSRCSARSRGAAAIWSSASRQGAIPALPLNLALLKGASIVGVFWGEFARREPKANAAVLAELARWYGEGKVKPVIDSRLPMRELPAAYARMGSRKVGGKLVMTND